MSAPAGAAQTLLARGLSALIALVLASIVWPQLSALAGLAGLLLLVPALVTAGSRTRIVAILITAIGLACAVAAAMLGELPSLSHTGKLNQDLIAMLAGGAFVGLTLRSRGGTAEVAPESQLSGIPAVFRTGLVIHLLGSVLNMVTLGLVGDRLSAQTRLDVRDAGLLARSYSIAALWSPFWTVTALIVVLVPGVNLWRLFGIGAIFAVVFLALSTWQNAASRGPAVREFRGYSLAPRQLIVPVTLVVVVLGSHFLLPETPVPRLVLLASVGVTLVILWVRFGPQEAARMMSRVANRDLAASVNEVALFLAAGVMTVGASLLLSAVDFQLALPPFGPLLAWLLVLTIVVLSAVGVHPIIGISLAVSLLQPFTGDPTLLAAAITWAWAISAPTGPLSGNTIFLSQRYGLSAGVIVRQNLTYGLIGLALAAGGLAAVAAAG
ncbi:MULTISPECIES: hypothetical protein [unclassified Leucobacter]|uniref:hypothetical protein n=1 Tax=unclassified Leucobacter TaxID=2621730 RepID=UPI00165EAC82|nr:MULTISPECIES: hypothetical protein [unclassified Leucobacter]MBC9928615.1 hypothetical protein [Leucobacter sp. cx-169]